MSTTATEGWKIGTSVKGPGIPAPTGQYKVGSTQLVHKFPNEEHSLLTTLYYPSLGGDGYEYVLAAPHEKYAEGSLNFMKLRMPDFPFGKGHNWKNGVRHPALSGSPLYKESDSPSPIFPVIVFSHGLGGTCTSYGTILCDLASHGYVIASVEHRDNSAAVARMRVPGDKEGEWVDQWRPFIDNWVVRDDKSIDWEKTFPFTVEQVKQRAVDARRALDLLGLLNEGSPVGNLLGVNVDFAQFKGRLNMETVGIMGHSFGGSTTIQTLFKEPRFKCGVCLDSWMLPVHKDLYGKVLQPMVFINASNFQWKQNVLQMMQMTREPNQDGISTSRIITLKKATHFSQTDIAFLFPFDSPLGKVFRTEIEPVIINQANLDIIHAFLKRHLLNDPAFQGPVPNLDGTDGHSPHILFGTNVDLGEEAAKL